MLGRLLKDGGRWLLLRLLEVLLCTCPLPLLSLRCLCLVLTECVVGALGLLLLIALLELVLRIVKSRVKLLLLGVLLLLGRGLLLLVEESLAQLAQDGRYLILGHCVRRSISAATELLLLLLLVCGAALISLLTRPLYQPAHELLLLLVLGLLGRSGTLLGLWRLWMGHLLWLRLLLIELLSCLV